MKKLILASASSYRRSLLNRLLVDFDCVPSTIDEDFYKHQIKSGKELSQLLSKLKAKDVFQRAPESLVLGSDQCLELEGEIMGKPHTKEKAIMQLLKLQGKTHKLYTSFTLLSAEINETYTQEVGLEMKALTQEELKRYVEKDLPLDCAGSYKLEESGIALFNRIDCDDYTGVVGLPLIHLSKRLKALGYELF